MLCWPLYTAHPASRWLCASVPALAGLRFAAVGAGLLRDDALVASSSVSWVQSGQGVLGKQGVHELGDNKTGMQDLAVCRQGKSLRRRGNTWRQACRREQE